MKVDKMIACVHEVETYVDGLRMVEARLGGSCMAIDFKSSAGKWLPSATRGVHGELPSASIVQAVEGLAMFLLNGRIQ